MAKAIPLPRESRLDLYPKSRHTFARALFENPTSEYRGCPLWSWNTRLHKPLLRKEIRALQKMGIGGFTMHARVGLDTPYLGEEFMACAAASIAEAKKLGMKAFLYDEDRWPSGAAGGLITKDDPSLRMLHLLFTPWSYGTPGHGADHSVSTGSAPFRGESGYLLGRYAIHVDESGYMTYRHMQNVDDNQPSDVLQPGEQIWYAYVESSPASSWYNDAWYVDTMSPRAMAAFLDFTHEKYYNAKGIGSEFGKTVTAIFTDEPQFSGMVQLDRANELKDCFAPWTEGLQNSFKNSTGLDLVASLPELFWDCAVEGSNERAISLTRYKYHDHTSELFTSAFLDQLSEWCEQHSLGQMGHMMEEPTLLQQTQCLGEAMRTYRSMQIPGVDMLVDAREYNTVKQCSSVAKQYNRTGCMSELYGVTNWTFSFKDYKGQGDWQAALGVTLRSHHLSWVSMNGEAKRDYPAQIGYQSPWYQEYGFVEDHFARVVVAMSRGKARTRVAVIHPIESFWLSYGCKETGIEQDAQDRWFASLTEWLLFDLVDFDFLSESLLPELVSEVSHPLNVGAMKYEVIILPQLLTIRSTTLSILEAFVRKGGKVIVAGRDPAYVDARPSTRFHHLHVDRTNFEHANILRLLEPYRDIRIIDQMTGRMVKDLLYQWREDGSEQYIYMVNTDRDATFKTRVYLQGKQDFSSLCVDVLETIDKPCTDPIWELKVERMEGGKRVAFDWRFDGCASLLLRIRSKTSDEDQRKHPAARHQRSIDWSVKRTVMAPVSARLSEPNCLLLDYCRYKVDEDPNWSELDEILRIDDQIRDRLGMHRRGDAMAQPWITPRPRPQPSHTVQLQYYFTTDVALDTVMLALEGAEITKILLDGSHVPRGDHPEDSWVDSCINKVPLPQIAPGKHEIILKIPFDELNTCLERIYLLGDFYVSIDAARPRGQMARISRATLGEIGFGDYTKQGLPFYTGNIEYAFDVACTGKPTAIRVPQLGINPILGVALNGHQVGRIGLPPYLFDLPICDASTQATDKVTLTVFGNRDHAFGAVHVPDGALGTFGPNAWRTTGALWSDAYTIRPMGLLQGLEILRGSAH